MDPYLESTSTDPARNPPSGARWTGRAGATPIPLPNPMEKMKKIIPIGDDPMSLYFAHVVAWQRENPGKRFTMWEHRRVLRRIRGE